MLLKCSHTVTHWFILAPATACIRHSFYLETIHFTAGFKVSSMCSALVHKAADEIRITILYSYPSK